MGFFESIAKGGLEGLLGGAGQFAKDVRAAITGEEVLTAEQKTQLLVQAATLEQAALNADVAQMQGQVEINKIEAASDSLFKSGWRPGVGWVCCAGLALYTIIVPLMQWGCALAGYNVTAPKLDYEPLWAILPGMLGLGAFRTFEKVKGAK